MSMMGLSRMILLKAVQPNEEFRISKDGAFVEVWEQLDKARTHDKKLAYLEGFQLRFYKL
jgi:hypothetical protein